MYNHTECYLLKKKRLGRGSKYSCVQNTYVNIYDGGVGRCNL